MGKILRIVKVKEENTVHYYEVSNMQYDNPTEFFIAIDPLKKTVSYFLTSDFRNPLTVLDLNVDDKIIPVSPFDKGLAESAFLLAGSQAFKAIFNNHFPEHIGICS